MRLLLIVVLFSISAGAAEFRRETTMPLGECDTSNYSPAVVKATAFVNSIKDRIVAANPEVFRDDLAPARICAGVDSTNSQRAWAATRSFVVESGLILRVQNDAQLAYAIAHELAHLSMRHNTDGVPVTGANRDSVRAQQRLVQELQLQVQNLEKGSAAHAANFEPLSARLEAAKSIVNNAIIAEHGAHVANNWDEGEADLVGSHLMLRAGFSGKEVAWRVQQLAISDAAGLDPHSPAPQISAEARTAQALTACGASSVSTFTEPVRGNGPYPSACWTIWKLTKDEPAKDSTYRTLFNGNIMTSIPGAPTLSEVQAEIRTQLAAPALDAKEVSAEAGEAAEASESPEK